MNLKIEQIKQLAAKKSYKEAAAIAKEMSWHKVKDWNALATVINVQEAVGDYEEARDMAILAYNRNLGGRKLVYKLTEIMIKLKQFDDADGLYEEYERMSQHDVSRYILYYILRKAEGASDNELVEILEDYKNHEIDEKYMYELACLYAKTGRKDECIKACDELALLFQDGIYVEKSMELKQGLGAPLTTMQIKILDDAKLKKHDDEKTKEIMFEQQKELARIRQDDIEEALKEDDDKEAGKPETEAESSDDKKAEQAKPQMQSIDAGSLMAATLEPWDEPVKEEGDEQTEEIEINIEETDELPEGVTPIDIYDDKFLHMNFASKEPSDDEVNEELKRLYALKKSLTQKENKRKATEKSRKAVSSDVTDSVTNDKRNIRTDKMDSSISYNVPTSIEDGIMQYFGTMDRGQRKLIQMAIENNMPELLIRKMFVMQYDTMKQFYDSYFN